MAVKILVVPEIGPVSLHKRRGQKAIRLSVAPSGGIRVSMPIWVTYGSALRFVISKTEWIKKQPLISQSLTSGMRVGKSHRLEVIACSVSRVSASVRGNQIKVNHPHDLSQTHRSVQLAARRGALKALKGEANTLLKARVTQLAAKHNLKFNKINFKFLKSRWGSCSQKQDLTFNVGLLHLPWELIDYVIIHELAHTNVLNHGINFWNEVGRYLPEYRLRRKDIKLYRPTLGIIDSSAAVA